MVRVGLKPTLIVHVPPGCSVMPEQFWLTTAKSPALPTSLASSRDGRLGAGERRAEPSPSLVTTTGLALFAAAVPAATGLNCCGAALATPIGSLLRLAALSAVLTNGLKFVGPPMPTGSRSIR